VNETATALADRYELAEVIGHGAMAEIREGVDLKLGRPVAVKVLRPDLADDAQTIKCFAEEAKLAGRLAHPNIVSVYDSGEVDGKPFIVMERLPGSTLQDEIAAGPFQADRVRVIALQCLAALDFAHRMNIVHRDIKPANILVTDDGQVKLADFGVAVSPGGMDVTKEGMVLGTPAYIAPERLEGHPATPSSDVYSLGIVLYTLLAGKVPFPGETTATVLEEVRRKVPRHIAAVRPGLDRNLAEAIMRAMAKSPQERFGSAAAMREALREVAPARDVTSRVWITPDVVTQTQMIPVVRSPKKSRRLVIATVALLIATSAGTVTFAAMGSDNSGTPAGALDTTPPSTVAPTSLATSSTTTSTTSTTEAPTTTSTTTLIDVLQDLLTDENASSTTVTTWVRPGKKHKGPNSG